MKILPILKKVFFITFPVLKKIKKQGQIADKNNKRYYTGQYHIYYDRKILRNLK